MQVSNIISGYVILPAIFLLTIISATSPYAADTVKDSDFHLRDGEMDLKQASSFKSSDEGFFLLLGGRIQGDATWFLDDSDHVLGGNSRDSEFRRARLFASGKAFYDWRYRIEYEFASHHDFASYEDSRFRDAWMGYTGFRQATIRAGNLQEPFSLEAMTSSSNITFMERALPQVFAQNYKLGVLINTNGKNWGAAAGLFGRGIHNGGEDGRGVAARATGAPILGKGRLLHIGAAFAYREPKEVNYNTRPEANLANRLLGTGTLRNVQRTITVGLEAAAVYGPFSLQGEYMQLSLQRSNGRSEPDFDGWYAYSSWFLTGESRRYNVKRGTFRQIIPKGKFGAWELAARYSASDLEEENITGGEEHNTTIGLNWYLNRNTRIMANYIRVNANPDRRGNHESPKILQLRAQLMF